MATGSPVRMRRDINLLHASSIMTGVIIGSGIFISPSSFIINSGSVGMSLLMWILSGILSLFVALCFTELGGMFPTAGGEYTFLRQVLGPLPGFVDIWTQFTMVQPSFQALLAMTTTTYIVQAVVSDSCGVPPLALRFFSAWIIVTMVALNSVYVKYVTRVQAALTALKLIALIGIIVIGIVQLAKGHTDILSTAFQGTSTSFGGHAISVNSGIFTYMGWQYVFCLMEEIKDPKRIVPPAVVISITTVIFLYTLTNVAYFTVLTPEEMMSSKAVALTFAEKTIGKFSKVVPFFVACAAIGSLNGAILGGSRMYYAAACDDLFPSLMSAIHVKYFTPWMSLFSVTTVAIFYVATGEALAILEFLGFVASTALFTCIYCLLYLRWKKPHAERPIKIPIVIPVVCFFVLGGLLLLAVYQAPSTNGVACLLMCTGVPVYCVFVLWASKHRGCKATMAKVNICVQKCFLLVQPDKEDFIN